MNKIVAIVGMCGSGKSMACDVFRQSDWHYIRFGQLTIDKLKQEGKRINPANEREMRESLRSELGMGAFALLLLPQIEKAAIEGNVIIDGLYSWSEYKILKEKFGENIKIFHIYASPQTRYTRLEERAPLQEDREHRMRRLSEREARERDYSEIENIEKGGPIAMADFTVINEGSLEALREMVGELVRLLD